MKRNILFRIIMIGLILFYSCLLATVCYNYYSDFWYVAQIFSILLTLRKCYKFLKHGLVAIIYYMQKYVWVNVRWSICKKSTTCGK